MRLVTGTLLPVFNHPLKLAGEIAMLDAISGAPLDVGLARAFLPHEFRRFGISPDESYARFREGLEQVELLLTTEHATHRGAFHAFADVTSLPRPTQKPRPPFYIAATQTPDTFEFAGRAGHALMVIPIGPLRGLLELYRRSWKEAGHPGDGDVMVAFHMFCHRDPRLARDIARKPFETYFRALGEAAGDWVTGPASKDYRDYDKAIAKMKGFTVESQVESGGAWIGTPAEITDNHRARQRNDRSVRARFAAGEFRRPRFHQSDELAAAVRRRGHAGICVSRSLGPNASKRSMAQRAQARSSASVRPQDFSSAGTPRRKAR